jgi:hypothetical protein
MTRLWKAAWLALVYAACATSCAAAVSVAITPSIVHVQPGGQAQFTATVSGTSNNVVIWSLSGTTCSGITCGQITSTGLYIAPAKAPQSNVITVTATSLDDLSASASAAVILGATSDITVSVSPLTATVVEGQQQRFVALVQGTTITNVTWSLISAACATSSCGTLTQDGLYTAPPSRPTPPQVTIKATSVADPAKSGSATVTVAASVAVSVSPKSAQINAGLTQQFTANVNGTANTAVSWSVSGSGCSGAACGTISSRGLYTAPSTVPSPAQVSVTATSVADPTKKDSAVVTITPGIAVNISPLTATILTGAQQQFRVNVTGTTNTEVTWSVVGTQCSGAACGTITASGLYTAPSAVPNPPQISVTATSVADPTRSATAQVTVVAPVVVAVSPATANVLVGSHQQFKATVTGTSNTAVTWSVSGAGCTGTACGTISTTGLFTAPPSAPAQAQVTVKATSVADPTKSGTALVTISGPVSLTISPTSALVIVGSSQQFTARISGTSNTAATWSVRGTGCTGTACGTVSGSGLYTAPPAVPNAATVFVTATSVADPTKSATATLTILLPIIVNLSPGSATVVTSRQQQFTATVTGNPNTTVVWSVSGSGCTGTACGQISSTGLYTAPATVPTPALVTVKVASAADPNIFRTTTVTIIRRLTVKVLPAAASVVVGTSKLFAATITGSTDQKVTWSVSGTGCTGGSCGTISSAGLYVAPAAVPSPATVTVKATSVLDSSSSGTATVTILPPVNVTLSPSVVQEVVDERRQFIAAVTGATDTNVTWSLAGAGCNGSTCGTITSTGLYTAPAGIPRPAQVTVRATSMADRTKSATATVTIIAPVTVAIAPATTVVAVKGQQQFRTSVIGSTDETVEWSLSGAGCSGSTCGTITSSGLYTAPASMPAIATIIVTATSHIDPARSAAAIVTIVASDNSKLRGPYSFQFTGFDTSGIYQATGILIADGKGNITSGTEDVNRTSGPMANVAFTGTYHVTNDNRGVMTFAGTAGNQTFRFALNLASAAGQFIEFDSSGIRGSGSLERQDPSAFNTSALKGGYVFSLAGRDAAGQRIGALSILYFDGSGRVQGGIMDVNQGGTRLTTIASIRGTYQVDNTGHGPLRLSIQGLGGGQFQFALYVISADKLALVSMDQLSSANPIFSGSAELQVGGPYQQSSFRGPTVFSLAGGSGDAPEVVVGQISFDGISQLLAQFDQNVGGTVTTGIEMTGAYSVSVNGTGTLNLDDSNGATRVWLIYAIGPNHAYLMDDSSSAVGMGELDGQSAQPPFTAASTLGPYAISNGEPLVYGATLYSGQSNFDGLRVVSGVEDISHVSSVAADQTLAGTYNVSSSQFGRETLTFTSPNGMTVVLWIRSASDGVGMEIDASNPDPVVLHFKQ